jgi:hypothetical protein
VNDILFVLGCEDNEGFNGLRVWRMVFWGYVDNGNKVEGVEGVEVVEVNSRVLGY